jgi:uncharacterized protein (TIGR02284 family)
MLCRRRSGNAVRIAAASLPHAQTEVIPMANKNADLLQELVQIARDSKSFYESAAKAVNVPTLKAEFQRMADAKARLISNLSVHISAHGEQPETSGTLAGDLRKGYGKMLAAIGSKGHQAYTYTAQLEETEDRLLKHFEQALKHSDSTQAVRAVSAQSCASV